jgi:chromosome segregation ATPase
LSKTSDSEYDK